VLEGLLNSFWAGAALWTLLYISDYALTLVSARLYRAGANDKIVFEGSYELTPYYQGDIDSLRAVSPRFLLALLFSLVLLFSLWWLTLEMYSFALGAMILIELTVHMRHVRNLFLFRAIVSTDEVRGRIEYSRPLMLRLSSLEILMFAVLFTLLFAYKPSWFVFGGVVSCLSQSVNHWKLAQNAAVSKIQATSST
jgi:hypothetical protein